MSKKKQGHIAVPFLVTIFIGLLIIGGAAVYIYNYFGLGKQKELSEPVARVAATATYEDTHTVLLVLDTPEEKRCPLTFVLMRSIPKDKKVVFVGLPANTIAVVDGQQSSLNDSYTRGGVSTAVDFVNKTLGIEIDRYMIFNEEALCKTCDIMGGVNYTITTDIGGLKANTEQFLSGEQVKRVITYPLYEQGEVQRAYTASSICSSMLNQADGERLAGGLDRSFNTVINLVNSDITSADYKNRKVGLKDMLKNGKGVARFRVADGVVSGDSFILDDSFIEDLKNEYFSEDTEAKKK